MRRYPWGLLSSRGSIIRRLPMLGAKTIYVRVSRNRMVLRDIESGTEVEILPATPFTTSRLLVGDFAAAEHALRHGVRQVLGGGWIKPSPRVLIHQLEMTEGGLSDVETRVLRDLAIGAGARKVAVWTGPDLTDQQVSERLG